MQMEVGIEDCLHIEFEYDKARYHLKDSVIGKIYFLLVNHRPQICLKKLIDTGWIDTDSIMLPEEFDVLRQREPSLEHLPEGGSDHCNGNNSPLLTEATLVRNLLCER